MRGEEPRIPDVHPGAVETIAALTLPYAAHQRRASPLVVAAVDELTLPYRAHGSAAQNTRCPQVGVQLQRRLWILGHGLLFLGIFVLATIGGVWADAQAQIAAAHGAADTPRAANSPRPAGSQANRVRPTDRPAGSPSTSPPRITIPVLNERSAAVLPTAVVDITAEQSTITRLVIPAINLDRKVVEVGWTTEEIAGQAVAVWDVDRYRVGHHRGSSNPGGGSNIVLAGHSGGTAYPFNDLFYLKPGDLIEVTSAGQLYQYTVTEQHLVDEVGQPLEQRLENARFMEPTDEEVITMIACWPLTGPAKFTQRVIIRATPIQMPAIAPELSLIHPR